MNTVSCVSGAETSPAPVGASPARQGVPQEPPGRPTTKEACDVCQGIWAVHGIDMVEKCICKTSDGGRACTDGNDCEGACLLDVDAEFHVMDANDPPRGYYQGHCASYDTTFGCFAQIPDDIQSALPVIREEASQFICVD